MHNGAEKMTKRAKSRTSTLAVVDDRVQWPATDLRRAAANTAREVTYAVSYDYNGGTSHPKTGVWVKGYKVPPPIIPHTHELISLGVGLQLNNRPPTATCILRPKAAAALDAFNASKRK